MNNKNMLVSLLLIACVVIFFNGFIIPHFFPQYKKAQKTEEPIAPTQHLLEESQSAVSSQQTRPQEESFVHNEQEAIDLEKEELYTVENRLFSLVLSNHGGGIKEVVLKEFEEEKNTALTLVSSQSPRSYALAISRLGSHEALSFVSYTWKETQHGGIFSYASDQGFSIQKELIIDPETYTLRMNLSIKNTSEQLLTLHDGFDIMCGELAQLKKEKRASYLGVDGFLPNGKIQRFKAKKAKDAAGNLFRDSFHWAGVRNKYFALILKPEKPGAAIGLFSKESATEKKRMRTSAFLRTQPLSLDPGKIYQESFLFYVGPKNTMLLAQADPTFKGIFDFGFFSPFCKVILWSLQTLYKLCRNYGLAIILLTILLKLLMHPLTQKSMQSMKKMQKIQPLVNELKEKYKSDTKKLQAETMTLYKEHGVNPMGGCLPMLLQIPIFIALFNTLRSAVELWGAKFLWIRDLSQPDTIAHIGGLPINILVLIMGATMFIQQKQTAVDPKQQKMMVMMPVVFTFMFYNFPAGLVLYWLVNNVLSIVQQVLVNRSAAKVPAIQ